MKREISKDLGTYGVAKATWMTVRFVVDGLGAVQLRPDVAKIGLKGILEVVKLIERTSGFSKGVSFRSNCPSK